MNILILRRVLLGLVMLGTLAFAGVQVRASDLPTAAGSPIAGISFDDRPLMLPVQRNFQMAMLTASSELGRSCGRMEAYGWRMAGDEQDRVNQLFNNTVDRMRAQGYVVESKAPSSVSKDVTLFTADRADRHLIFLWSAGEIGLVMVLCETSAPLPAIGLNATREAEATQPATLPSHLPISKTSHPTARLTEAKPAQLSVAGRPLHAGFMPTGKWIGNYTCSQGTTGATLRIERVKGDQFDGVFQFYPTSKNPYVPKGSYSVFGEYDADSQRILINPGKWIDRPKEYYNTIMIGSFDPVSKTFSGYFQGITGCTSFEASQETAQSPHELLTPSIKKKATKAVAPVKKAKAKKTTAQAASPKKTSIQIAPMEGDPATSAAAAPAPAAPVAPPKSDLSIIGAPAKVVPPASSGRSSSIEPPPGIFVGSPSDKK